MLVPSKDSGKLQARHPSRSLWSASRPSWSLMPRATRPVLLWYDTPGLVRLVQRLDKAPAVGRSGAGGGSGPTATPNAPAFAPKVSVLPEAKEVTPAPPVPISATLAAPAA